MNYLRNRGSMKNMFLQFNPTPYSTKAEIPAMGVIL